ncbi:sortase [Streptomyces sp. NPDC048018]|uniref:sortase n=1 Tax=Streptomyces sp. NPDC048018 TaxID=3365499 RepID=UPI0037152F5C
MIPARTALQAVLVVGTLVLSGPAALAAAAEPAVGGAAGDARIFPAKAAPGTTVTVTTSACGKETYGKGESETAGQFHLFQGERPGTLVGTFQVPEDAASGTDTVTLKCPPRIKQTVTYQVSGRPNGAVDAGYGWAAAAEQTDSSDGQLVLGALLLGGAVAGGAIRMRRRATNARPSA